LAVFAKWQNFFANGVLIYQEEWKKIVNFLEKNGLQFSFRYVE
jgi:hypothetical protein